MTQTERERVTVRQREEERQKKIQMGFLEAVLLKMYPLIIPGIVWGVGMVDAIQIVLLSTDNKSLFLLNSLFIAHTNLDNKFLFLLHTLFDSCERP